MQGAGTAAHEAMQQRVFGLVDNTHPATAELLNDAVVRDGLADHEQELRAAMLGTLMEQVNRMPDRQER